jgi:hypothetical protein
MVVVVIAPSIDTINNADTTDEILELVFFITTTSRRGFNVLIMEEKVEISSRYTR